MVLHDQYWLLNWEEKLLYILHNSYTKLRISEMLNIITGRNSIELIYMLYSCIVYCGLLCLSIATSILMLSLFFFELIQLAPFVSVLFRNCYPFYCIKCSNARFEEFCCVVFDYGHS